MSILDATDFARASTSIAESFIDAYYNAISGPRKQLESFYLAKTVLNGRALPYISYNGNVTTDAADFQAKFVNEAPFTYYDPQSHDVQVLNPSLVPLDSKSKKEHERNMSLLVLVSGYVRLHERKDGPMRGFSDSLVLVPNKEELGGKQTGKMDAGRQWVIQTQNFRFVT